MKSNYLLPNKCKIIGWVLFGLGLIAGITIFLVGEQPDFLYVHVVSIYNDGSNTGIGRNVQINILQNNIAGELASLFFIIGALLIGFSKEKVEDEFIYKLRTDSLVWAVLLNSLILILAIIFVYDFAFFDIMVFNMFTTLVFFVLRFNFLKFQNRSYEE